MLSLLLGAPPPLAFPPPDRRALCARRLCVCTQVLAQGSMLQLIVGTLLSAIFLLFQVQASPYVAMADDFLASAASFGLVAIFLCSIAFKDHEIFGLSDIQDRMSTEQRSLYVVNQSSLTVVMIASVLGALILSFVLFIVQFIIEGRRLRREVLAMKARRLRFKSDQQEVRAPVIELGHFHTFLSHVWGTGQDQMRIVKQRLLEMIPDLSVFLDVDDLEEIGELEGYVNRTSIILVYCSKGYFTSKNCMRELVASTTLQKPIIALTDPDASRGGMSLAEVHSQLIEADALAIKWGFHGADTPSSGTEYQEAYLWPGGEMLHEYLFGEHEPIEWNRIGHFQDITMRQVAERLLPDAAGATYVDREIVSAELKPLPPPKASFHVFCSQLNPGAMALMEELSRARGFQLQLGPAATDEKTVNVLHVTHNADQLCSSDHMLLYLTAQTWTRPFESTALRDELLLALELGVHVQLAHEMPGAGGQEERFGCEFGDFFGHPDGATPANLLKRGIYSEIAVPLKGGPWREASMVLMGMALGMSKEDLATAQVGGDVLGLDVTAQSGVRARFAKRRRGLVQAMSSMSQRASSGSLSLRPATRGKAVGQKAATMPSVSVTSATIADAGGSASEPVAHNVGASVAADAALDTQHATFGDGPMGLGLKQRGGEVVISTVDGSSQASEQGVLVDSIILEVAGASVSGLTKADVLGRIKSAPRPVTLLLGKLHKV